MNGHTKNGRKLRWYDPWKQKPRVFPRTHWHDATNKIVFGVIIGKKEFSDTEVGRVLLKYIMMEDDVNGVLRHVEIICGNLAVLGIDAERVHQAEAAAGELRKALLACVPAIGETAKQRMEKVSVTSLWPELEAAGEAVAKTERQFKAAARASTAIGQ